MPGGFNAKGRNMGDADKSGQRTSIIDKNTITSLGVVGGIAVIILPLTFWLGGVFNKSGDQDKQLTGLQTQLTGLQTQMSELKGFMTAQAIRDESQTSQLNQLTKNQERNSQTLADHETRLRIMELKKSP